MRHAKLRSAIVRWSLIGIIVFGVFDVTMVMTTANDNPLPKPVAAVPASTVPSHVPAIAGEPKTTDPTAWKIHERMDFFTNKNNRWATLQSLNTFELGFPYQGQQHATLIFWSDEIHGTAQPVFRLVIERGQLLCGIEGCKVNFKYDKIGRAHV